MLDRGVQLKVAEPECRGLLKHGVPRLPPNLPLSGGRRQGEPEAATATTDEQEEAGQREEDMEELGQRGEEQRDEEELGQRRGGA
ncbi:unnamed protein product [Gadus morhua 'NCC']